MSLAEAIKLSGAMRGQVRAGVTYPPTDELDLLSGEVDPDMMECVERVSLRTDSLALNAAIDKGLAGVVAWSDLAYLLDLLNGCDPRSVDLVVLYAVGE